MLIHRGRNGLPGTTKKETGKSQELLYQENCTLFLKKKKYSHHTEEKWVFSQARNKKRSESKAVSEMMMLKFDGINLASCKTTKCALKIHFHPEHKGLLGDWLHSSGSHWGIEPSLGALRGAPLWTRHTISRHSNRQTLFEAALLASGSCSSSLWSSFHSSGTSLYWMFWLNKPGKNPKNKGRCRIWLKHQELLLSVPTPH